MSMQPQYTPCPSVVCCQCGATIGYLDIPVCDACQLAMAMQAGYDRREAQRHVII